MNFRKRRFLFLIVLISFFILGPLIALYSQGYKFDFQNRKFVQTGGIFIKAFPPDCLLYINKKFRTKTSPFTGTALATNFLPKKYYIEIKKDGYYPWEKNLDIEEKMVTDAKNIYLIPKNIGFLKFNTRSGTSTDFRVDNFLLSPDESKLSIMQSSSLGQKISIVDIDNNKSSTIWKNPQSGLYNMIDWSPDGKSIIVNTKNNKNPVYTTIDTNNGTVLSSSTNYISVLLNNNSKNKNLLSDLKNAIVYKVLPHSILILSKEGFLVRSNFDGTIAQIYNLNPVNIQKNKSYQIISKDGNNLFLKEGNNLYYLNPQSHCFNKISDSAVSLSLSPDLKKLAFSDGHDIWIFYLKPEYSQPIRKAHEIIFLTRFSKEITDLQWLNPNYIIFSLNNKITISEIDNRDRINVESVNSPPFSRFIFNQRDRKIYLLNKEGLYISQAFRK